jgi:hypothetical protein
MSQLLLLLAAAAVFATPFLLFQLAAALHG